MPEPPWTVRPPQRRRRVLMSSWTAWHAITATAKTKLTAHPAKPPSQPSVEETTCRRPGRFITGLVNPPTTELWDLFEGRSKAVLADRLRQLGGHVVKTESVVIDPYPADNTRCVSSPHAIGVAARFHIERLAARAVTDARTRRQQDITGHRGRGGDPLHAARRDLIRAREEPHRPGPPSPASGQNVRLVGRRRVRLDPHRNAPGPLRLPQPRHRRSRALAPLGRHLRRGRHQPARQNSPSPRTRDPRLLRHSTHDTGRPRAET